MRLPLTAPHYFDFGSEREQVGSDLVRPDRWDALRLDTRGAFAMARSRSELEAQLAAPPELRERALVISEVLQGEGAVSLASYGVGGGVLELALAEQGWPLLITEYAPRTVERLRVLLPEAETVQHDLRKAEPLSADWHLFHRIDTEHTGKQWNAIFNRFAQARVVFIPGEVASLRRLLAEVQVRLRSRRASHAGWLRNRAALEALWRDTHRARAHRFHDLDGWLLLPREATGPSGRQASSS
jgi:hypothetical protein